MSWVPNRPVRTWRGGPSGDNPNLFITTGCWHLYRSQINDILSQPDFTWGKPQSDEQNLIMITKSICFAVFEESPVYRPISEENVDLDPFDPHNPLTDLTSVTLTRASPKLVGIGRWITDEVSVVYVNDIYVLPEYRRQGLAGWMLACMNEQLASMPDLRGVILIVEKGSSMEQLYKRRLDMEDLAPKDGLLVRSGPGEPAVLTNGSTVNGELGTNGSAVGHESPEQQA